MKKEDTVNVSHARGKKDVYEKIVQGKVCPFCADFSERKDVFQYHSKPALFHGTHWVVTENFDPYEGTSYHLMFIHRKHITSFSELTTPSLEELVSLTKKLEEKFSLPAGVFLFRFGATEYTGGSVNHFHGHFVLGDKGVKGESEPLTLFAGYKKKGP